MTAVVAACNSPSITLATTEPAAGFQQTNLPWSATDHWIQWYYRFLRSISIAAPDPHF